MNCCVSSELVFHFMQEENALAYVHNKYHETFANKWKRSERERARGLLCSGYWNISSDRRKKGNKGVSLSRCDVRKWIEPLFKNSWTPNKLQTYPSLCVEVKGGRCLRQHDKASTLHFWSRPTNKYERQEGTGIATDAFVKCLNYDVTYTFPLLAAVIIRLCCTAELKQNSPYTGLGKPLGLREVEDPRISWQSAVEIGKIVSPTHRRSYPQEMSVVLISLRG